MKKIIFLCCISCLLFSACGKKEINALKEENASLRATISQLQEEIQTLKQTDQYYYQQGIDLLEQKQYEKAEEVFSALIARFPTGPLMPEAQKQLDKMKKDRAKGEEALKALPEQLAKAPNALAANKILDELLAKYSYPDIQETLKQYQAKIQAQVAREQELQTAPKELGIEISHIQTYWVLTMSLSKETLSLVPYIQFVLKNVGDTPITQLRASAVFTLPDNKEISWEGATSPISSAKGTPLAPGASREVLLDADDGYPVEGYDLMFGSSPRAKADLFLEVNGSEKKIVQEINIRRERRE